MQEFSLFRYRFHNHRSRRIGCIYFFSDYLQLAGLNMLRTELNHYKTFLGHVAVINLKNTDKISLSKSLPLSKFADIFSNAKIRLDFLLHSNTLPAGLKWARMGLFYVFPGIQVDRNGSTFELKVVNI